MARQKTVDVVYKRIKQPNGKYKFVKTQKIKTTATNVSKGANTGSRPWKTDSAALKSEKITADLSAQKAKFAARSANVATLTSGATQIAQSAIGAAKPQSSTEQVQQAINGGVQPSDNRRDEDEDDQSPYVV